MKKTTFSLFLAIFSIFAYGQVKFKPLTTSQGYQSHSIANDTTLLIVCEESHIKLWDLKNGKALDSINTMIKIKNAGFIDVNKIGIIYNNDGVDNFFIFELHAKYRTKDIVLSFIPQTSYNIFFDKDNYYITLPVQAKSWVYKKSNNLLVRTENDVVYSNESGEIIKHLYSKNGATAYGIENVKTHQKYSKTVIGVKSLNSQSFNSKGDMLMIADAEQISKVSLFNIDGNVKKINTIVSNKHAISFISFFGGNKLLIMESSFDIATGSKHNYLTVYKINIITHKQELIYYQEIQAGNLSGISISSNKKYLTYELDNTIYSAKLN